MKDEDNTPKDLMDELAQLRQRLAGLEATIAEYRSKEMAAEEREERLESKLEVIQSPSGEIGEVEIPQSVDFHAEQKRAGEEALRNTEQKSRSVIEKAPIGIFLTTADGKLTAVNSKLAEMFGYASAEEMISAVNRTSIAESCHVDPEARTKILRKAMESKGEWVEDENLMRRNGGETITVRLFFRAVSGDSGESATLEGFVEDITERRRAEDALRTSEMKYRIVADNTYDWEYWVNPEGQYLYSSPSCQRITGYPPSEFEKDPGLLSRIIHPDDLAQVAAHLEPNHSADAPCEMEFRIIRHDSTTRWIGHVCQPVVDVEGRFLGRRGCNRDISRRKSGEEALQKAHDELEHRVQERTAELKLANEELQQKISEWKRAEILLRIQHDLALVLGSTSSMAEAMERLLQAVLQIEGINSGRVYLADASTGDLRLISHVGPSLSIDQISRYAPDSPQAQFISQNEPAYWTNPSAVFDIGGLLGYEEIASLAVIPVKLKDRVVAVLTLASHSHRDIPESTRDALETIAARISGIVSRVSTEEALKMEQERLAEVNSALKVLLRQLGEDRRELEESLLLNLKNLVVPYLERLSRSRLSSDQTLLLEIIESHLKEITSPFLRRLSQQFIELTPTEIRVADLIREGRVTKEIADILHTSERAVLFHRQNIRGKFGLKSRKVNLRSYLSSLP